MKKAQQKQTIPVVGNSQEDWDAIEPGTTFVTNMGAAYRRLPCGHFRHLNDTDDPSPEDVSVDWCWTCNGGLPEPPAP